MSNHANQAKRKLAHYLKFIALRAGAQWDSDNDAEIDDIVDSIIAAAVEEATRGQDGDHDVSAYQQIKRNADAARFQSRT